MLMDAQLEQLVGHSKNHPSMKTLNSEQVYRKSADRKVLYTEMTNGHYIKIDIGWRMEESHELP